MRYDKILISNQNKNSYDYLSMQPESLLWLSGWNRYFKEKEIEVDQEDFKTLQKLFKRDLNNIIVTQTDIDPFRVRNFENQQTSIFSLWLSNDYYTNIIFVSSSPENVLSRIIEQNKTNNLSNTIFFGGSLKEGFFNSLKKTPNFHGYIGKIHYISTRNITLFNDENIKKFIEKHLDITNNKEKIGIYIDLSFLEEIQTQKKTINYSENFEFAKEINILEKDVYSTIETKKLIYFIDYLYNLCYLKFFLTGKDYKLSFFVEIGRLGEKFSRKHLWTIFYEIDRLLST